MNYESKVEVEFDGEDFVLPIRTPNHREALDLVHSMPENLDEIIRGEEDKSLTEVTSDDLDYVQENVTEYLIGARGKDVKAMSIQLQFEIFSEILSCAFDEV